MLKIRVLGEDNETVPREELITVYASDLNYEPYKRRKAIDPDGTINLDVPEGPVIVHARLTIPGFGWMWYMADNGGQGYAADASIDFIREAALSRLEEVDTVIKGGEFQPSPQCIGYRDDCAALLQTAETSPRGALLNRRALASGMWAGELAVVERARARIARKPRRDGFLFGCGGFSYPYPNKPGYKERFDSLFNYATLPFYLARLEVEKGKPDYSNLDRLQDEFEKNGIQTKGHPLWWPHLFAAMPDWTHELKWEDGSLQREIERTAKRSVSRYKGRIKYFDAINEAHDWCNAHNLTQRQEGELTKVCCDAMHEANPDSFAVVNTCFMWGEYAADDVVQFGPKAERIVSPYGYLENVEAVGTQYDAVGIQLYFPSRDMLAIDKMYDRYARFGKPIHITELGTPSHFQNVRPETLDGRYYALRMQDHGHWHQMEWTQDLQADWIEWYYTVSYAHPSVEAITWWSYEDPGYVPGSGLMDKYDEPKQSCFRLKALEKQLGFDFGKK